MKVALISANTSTSPHPVYPLGLDHVAAAIADRREVVIVDLAASGQGALEQIARASPDVVGISIRNIDNSDIAENESFIGPLKSLVKSIRAITAAPLVLGGAGFTIFPAELMEALDADFGIIGEGERLAGLLDAIERNQDPRGLAGVIVRGGPPVWPGTWERPFSRIFPSEDGRAAFYLGRGGILNFQTKRGCPFNSVYC